MRPKFLYQYSGSLIQTNTLSPSGKFYYKLQKPNSINPASFACRIAFYDVNEELLYHRQKTYAHEIHDKDEVESLTLQMKLGGSYQIENERPEHKSLELVRWSKQGNVAYILEYIIETHSPIYESVFLHLQDRCCFRINESINSFEIVNQLKLKDREYDELEIISNLQTHGFVKEDLRRDKLNKTILSKLFNSSKWNP